MILKPALAGAIALGSLVVVDSASALPNGLGPAIAAPVDTQQNVEKTPLVLRLLGLPLGARLGLWLVQTVGMGLAAALLVVMAHPLHDRRPRNDLGRFRLRAHAQKNHWLMKFAQG